jgi:CubicO group peptidase (beta-lactamase class C family)
MNMLRSGRTVIIAAVVLMSATGCDRGGSPTDTTGNAVPASHPDLDRALTESLEEVGTPGASAAVVFADGSRWSGEAGKADVERDRDVTPDTPFAIASVSKTFVAALALDLAEAGALDLDTPVARWLPHVPNGDRITLRMLLGHTSGLGETSPRDLEYRWTADEALDNIPEPLCEPAACFRYSDSNFVAAAAVIEAATGDSVAHLVRARFLDPLGMRHTWFQQAESDRGTTATGYRDGIPEQSKNGDVPATEFVTRIGYAGAAAATANDLATWTHALLGGDLLEPASRQAMVDFERSAPLPCADTDRCERGYGLGMGIDLVDGWLAWSHSGSTGAVIAYFPAQRVTIAVVTNGSPGIPPGPGPTLWALAHLIPELRSVPQLYELAADGSRRHRLSRGDATEFAPAISPDGRLAYATVPDSLQPDIVVAGRGNTQPRRITHDPGSDNRPEWSPDGNRIVFASDRAGDRDLYVMRDDGTDVHRIVATPGDDNAPAWSPDGRWIAWSHIDDSSFEIRVAAPDGRNQRTLVHQPSIGPHMGSPSWSPDSTRIAFAGADVTDGHDIDIDVIDLDGSHLRTLTRDHVPDLDPNFGPDGSIQFVRYGDLWLLPANGHLPLRITNTPEEEYLVERSNDGTTFIVTANTPSEKP